MTEEAAPAPGGDTDDGGNPAGGADESGGLYDLTSVPEDVRPHVEEHLKAIEANATKKFQQHAEAQKSWEPYEELGINEIDPQALGQLLEFAELAQDEERFTEWVKETGTRLGVFNAQGPDDLDFSDDDFADLTPEQIESKVNEAVEKALKPVQDAMAQSEQQQIEQETMAEITSQLDALKEEHGEELDTDAVLQLSYAYVDDDPDNAIQKGFEDFQRITAAGENGLLKQKAQQPGKVEGPGSADTAPEAIRTFEDAKSAAMERMKAARAAAT